MSRSKRTRLSVLERQGDHIGIAALAHPIFDHFLCWSTRIHWNIWLGYRCPHLLHPFHNLCASTLHYIRACLHILEETQRRLLEYPPDAVSILAVLDRDARGAVHEVEPFEEYEEDSRMFGLVQHRPPLGRMVAPVR